MLTLTTIQERKKIIFFKTINGYTRTNVEKYIILASHHERFRRSKKERKRENERERERKEEGFFRTHAPELLRRTRRLAVKIEKRVSDYRRFLSLFIAPAISFLGITASDGTNTNFLFPR